MREYKLVEADSDYKLERMLNELAKEGWKVVGYAVSSANGSPNSYCAVLERA